jgi:hypothetical protein
MTASPGCSLTQASHCGWVVCKTRKPGPAFVEMDEEEIRMQKMMASMKVSVVAGSKKA